MVNLPSAPHHAHAHTLAQRGDLEASHALLEQPRVYLRVEWLPGVFFLPFSVGDDSSYISVSGRVRFISFSISKVRLESGKRQQVQHLIQSLKSFGSRVKDTHAKSVSPGRDTCFRL